MAGAAETEPRGLLEGLSSERLLDPDAQVFWRLRAAFGPDDRLQGSGELSAVQARPALGEVLSQVGGLPRIELPVQEVLDVGQNFVAINL
ncbi:MAG TPA: hypothetical protein VHH54_05765 [Actinomycetota bacterium]|nr:hypothetical protein [Actinomycetota bacterium]